MKQRVNIYGEIGTEVTLKTVAAQIKDGVSEVVVHINSIGGDVSEGYAIHNFLKGLNANVSTVIEGACYSIATVIALAGDTRKMWPTAEIMIHNPWGSVQGEADEIRQYSEWIKQAEKDLAVFYSSRLAVSSMEITEQMKKTTFIDPAQALTMGFITEPAREFKAVAKINNSNSNKMTEISENDRSWLLGQFEKLQSAFKPEKRKAMQEIEVVTEGGDLAVYVDSEDGEIEGKKAFLDPEMTTPIPQGVHQLRDGREITANAEGVIESVKEAGGGEEAPENKSAMEEENEKLKAEIEAMKKELEASSASAQAAKEEKEEAAKASAKLAEEVKETKEAIEAIKAKFSPIIESKPGKGKGDAQASAEKSTEDEVLSYFKTKKAAKASAKKEIEEMDETEAVLAHFSKN